MRPLDYENKARPAPAPAPQHYTPVGKIGYPPGVRCWCGAELEFAYHEAGMKAKREAFLAAHNDCAAFQIATQINTRGPITKITKARDIS